MNKYQYRGPAAWHANRIFFESQRWEKYPGNDALCYNSGIELSQASDDTRLSTTTGLILSDESFAAISRNLVLDSSDSRPRGISLSAINPQEDEPVSLQYDPPDRRVPTVSKLRIL